MDIYKFLNYFRKDLPRRLWGRVEVVFLEGIEEPIINRQLILWCDDKENILGLITGKKILTEWGQLLSLLDLKKRDKVDIKRKDSVNLGYVIPDTSALIDRIVTKLVYYGLLKRSKIGIPIAVELELTRLEEYGKKEKKKDLVEKSIAGAQELNKLRRLAQIEKILEIELGIGSHVDWAISEKGWARATIMDKAIREIASENKAVLITMDSGLARIASSYPSVRVIYLHNKEQAVAYYLSPWKLWWIMINWLKIEDVIMHFRNKRGKEEHVKITRKEDDFNVERV